MSRLYINKVGYGKNTEESKYEISYWYQYHKHWPYREIRSGLYILSNKVMYSYTYNHLNTTEEREAFELAWSSWQTTGVIKLGRFYKSITEKEKLKAEREKAKAERENAEMFKFIADVSQT